MARQPQAVADRVDHEARTPADRVSAAGCPQVLRRGECVRQRRPWMSDAESVIAITATRQGDAGRGVRPALLHIHSTATALRRAISSVDGLVDRKPSPLTTGSSPWPDVLVFRIVNFQFLVKLNGVVPPVNWVRPPSGAVGLRTGWPGLRWSPGPAPSALRYKAAGFLPGGRNLTNSLPSALFWRLVKISPV